MSLLDFNSIPGFREAVNEETQNRELAFFSSPLPVAGVSVRHYSARHHLLLIGCDNHFLTGGIIRSEDIAMFLWFVSPEYVAGNQKLRSRFIRRNVRGLPYAETKRAIETYLSLQDWPASTPGGKKHRDHVASVAFIVDRLALEYGWSDEMILEMPLARVFQYLRIMTMRADPKALMFSPSDRLISKHLQARMSPSAN